MIFYSQLPENQRIIKTNICHGQQQIMKNNPPPPIPSTIQTHNDSRSAETSSGLSLSGPIGFKIKVVLSSKFVMVKKI
jgi:hypothetical protein